MSSASHSNGLPVFVVVNLERSTERRARTEDMLSSLNIPYEIFSAVDGKTLPPSDQALYSPEATRSLHRRELTPGEVGCALSHIKIYEQFLATDRQEMVVIEDDAEVGVALVEVLRRRAELPADWELVNFRSDAPLSALSEPIWDIYRIGTFSKPANGTVCYLINRAGATRLLDHAYPVRQSADGLTGSYRQTGLHLYGVVPSVVGLAPVDTTIDQRLRNGTQGWRAHARLALKKLAKRL